MKCDVSLLLDFLFPTLGAFCAVRTIWCSSLPGRAFYVVWAYSAASSTSTFIGTGRYLAVDIDLTGEVAESDGMVCGGTMKVLVEDAAE